jgi:hypothetical protein
MRNNSIGKCHCGGDVEENGKNARCVVCGLLYDLEILRKNHSKNHQSQEAGKYVRTWGVPREPAAAPQ